MKKHIAATIILFLVLALPIPLSLMSWIGTLMSVAAIGMMDWSNLGQVITLPVALITMFLAGTYLGTYIFSLSKTIANKKISAVSLLPVLHIIVFSIFVLLWLWLNSIFQ